MNFNCKAYLLTCISLLYLSACIPPSTLLAGPYQPFINSLSDSPLKFGYVDAIGDRARFKKITAIGLDSKENVYVADSGNRRIRKILPTTGEVTTVAGSDESPLYLGGMTIFKDVLYYLTNGCIRSIDLQESPLKSTTFYGECGSEEKTDEYYNETGEVPKYLRDMDALTHDIHGNLYVMATSTQSTLKKISGRGIETVYLKGAHKIDENKKATLIDDGGNSFVVDGNECVTGYLYSTNIDPQSIRSNCRKGINADTFRKLGEKERDPRLNRYNIFSLLMGKNNDLYIFGDWLAKLDLKGELTFVAPVPALGEFMAFNASNTVIYSASQSAVYRWEIPKKEEK